MKAPPVCGAVNFQITVMQLNQEEADIVRTCVHGYSHGSVIFRLHNAMLSLMGRSSWQKAEKLISQRSFNLVPANLNSFLPQAQLTWDAKKTLKGMVDLNKHRTEIPAEVARQLQGIDMNHMTTLFQQIFARPYIAGFHNQASRINGLNFASIFPVLQQLMASPRLMTYLPQMFNGVYGLATSILLSTRRVE